MGVRLQGELGKEGGKYKKRINWKWRERKKNEKKRREQVEGRGGDDNGGENERKE